MTSCSGEKTIARWCAALVILIAFFLSRPAFGAVAIDTVSSGSISFVRTSTNLTFTHTSAANTYLVVEVSLNINTTGQTITSVTYNGVAMTLLGGTTNGSNQRVAFYGLAVATAVTNGNVVITPTALTGTNRVGIVAGAITFTGADPTTPVGTPSFAASAAAGTMATITVSGNPNQLILGAIATSRTATVTAGSGETQRWTAISTGGTANDVRGAGSTKTGASTVTFTETLSASSTWEMGAIPIYGAATGNLCANPGNDGVGNITSAVNSYYAPSAAVTLSPGTASVTLAAGAGANSNIASGDLLLIMQMQDADINSNNTSAYGAGTTTGSGYTALNSAGLYEYVVANNAVTFGTGGTLYFTGVGPGGGVVNTYTEAAFVAGSKGQKTFQVIRVPQYSSATLGNGSTNVAVATAWNGAVGGVLAIDVAGVLTLNGTVNVDALGFRGGAGRALAGGTGASTDYRTASSVATNGSKGESIAGTPQYLISGSPSSPTLVNTGTDGLPNGSYARGAAGTGGGGGTDGNPAANDQNTGGGGGGNGGAGGVGGNSWNSNLAVGGIGGVAFPAAISRVTMGGGGGAGTTNNGTENGSTDVTGIASSGGTGGGLVMIRTSELTGTGTISANGGSTLSTQNDSTGGGGAGGTVVVVAQHSALTGLTVSAVGGTGGNAWPTSGPGTGCPGGGNCNYHGPGGGGAGGVILLSSTAVTNVAGGANGTTTTSAVAYGATSGASGVVNTSATLAGMGGASSGSQCVPDLSIAGAGLTGLVRGSTWSYNLTVSNLGISSTSGQVTVDDPLPYGLAVTSASGTGWSCNQNGQDITCTRSDALAGFSASYPTIALAGTVIQSAPDSPTNTATTSGGGETYLGNDTVTANPTILSSADLSLTSTASPTLVAAAGVLTYTQKVTNSGVSDAAGLFFTSVIPANTTYQSIVVPSGWSCNTPAVGSAGTVSCVATYLAAGGSATFSIVTSVGSGVSAGTVVTNTASVSALTPDPFAYNNFTQTSATVGTGSDLAITDVASPTNVAVGSQITFTHVLTYTGTSSASTVTYKETLPATVSIVTLPSPGGSWTACTGTTTITCSVTTLATGSTVTFTTVVQVTSGTSVTDTALVGSTPADTYTGNNTASATVSVSASGTDLSVSDQASPVTVEAGNNIVFSHTVTNIGPNTTSGTVTLTDTLPAGTTYQSYTAPAGWTCVNASNVVTCTTNSGVTMASGTTASISVTTAVPSTASGGTNLTDNVTVSSTGDPVSGNNSASATSTVALATDLAVSVVSGTPDPITAGTTGTLAITYNVTNNGPAASGSTTFLVTIPSNTTYTSLTAPTGGGVTWTCNPPSNGQVLCTTSNLPVGYNQNFVLNVGYNNLSAGPPTTTTVSSTASASPAVSDKIWANNTATFSTVVTASGQTDLVITPTVSPSSGPVPVYAGQNYTIYWTITNKGPAAAANPSLTFTVPTGTTLVSYSVPIGCTLAGSTLTCSSTTAFPVGSANVSFTLATLSSDTSPITANVSVTSTTNGPNGSAASASASYTEPIVTSADLKVTNTCTPDQVDNGNIVCTQTITDLGPSDAQVVMLTEAQPTNTTSVSAPGCSLLLGQVSCNIGTVTVGTPVTITYTTKVNGTVARGTTITDTVNVTTSTTDPVSTNNTATATSTVAVSTDSDIGIAITPSASSVASGSNITFAQTVTNNGPATATSGTVTISEAVPANTTFVSATGTGWSCGAPSGGTFTCTSTASMASGASTTINLVVTTATGLAAQTVISDTATTGGTITDPNSANNTATANVTITDPNVADMSIAIAAASTTVRTGNSDTFTITATNGGPSTATNAVVTIPIPTLEQFVSATPSQGSCSVNGDVVTCLLGTMASGNSATISLVVNVINYGETTNTASVDADQTDTNTSNNTASVAILLLAPTEIKLVGFTAEWDGGQVVLEWRTKEEARNLGFNVYRELNGERVKLNPSPIAGTAVRMRAYLPQHTASAYSWIDPSPDARASYWLEDVSLSGARTSHGPVQATGVSGRASAKVAHSVLLANLNSAAQAPANVPVTPIVPATVVAADQPVTSPQPIFTSSRPGRGQRNAAAVSSATLAGQPAIRIAVNQEGWYKITQAQLSAAGLNPHADINALRLITEGTEIPMRVSASGGNLNSIEFYGIGLDNPYTDTRIYWLIWQSNVGLRLAQVDGTNGNLPASTNYNAEAVRQDRTFYFAALTTNGDQDNFFGDVVSSAPVDEHLQLSGIDQTDATSAQLDVLLQGITDPASHQVQVTVNGVSAGEITFADMGQGALVTELPVSLLNEGDNVVTLTPLGGDGDVTTVDHVIISYQRHFAAINNQLRFTVLGQTSVKLTGFTSSAIHVIDIDSQMTDVTVSVNQESDGSYSATFSNRNSSPGVYYAYTDSVIAQPLALTYHAPTNLAASSNAADLLIVSHSNFIPSLAPLVTKRQQQGLKVQVVDIDDVYSQFNYGEHSPYALQQFLQTASTAWATAPRWLLLVGDASVDPRNFLGFGSFDFVPTKIVPTSELKTASDAWLSDFNQTGYEQIATGRLPVRTAADTTTVVNKILAYESQTLGTWSSSAYLVADQNIGADFQSEASAIAGLLPANVNVTTLNVSNTSTDHAGLVAQLNTGNLLVNYIGHGSENDWADPSLFTDTDALALNNGAKAPMVISMDCLNGLFHDVYETSLAESLLLAPQGGAMAVWASSGLTDSDPQFGMDEALMQYLFATPAQTIGEATKNAKQGVADIDVRRTWILFGDPSMKLKSATGN